MDMTGIEPIELSLDEIQLLDDQSRGEYLAFKRIFGTDGWMQIKKLVKEQQQNTMNQQLVASTWDIVNRSRGAFAAFQVVLDLENAVETCYRVLVEQKTPGLEDDV